MDVGHRGLGPDFAKLGREILGASEGGSSAFKDRVSPHFGLRSSVLSTMFTHFPPLFLIPTVQKSIGPCKVPRLVLSSHGAPISASLRAALGRSEPRSVSGRLSSCKWLRLDDLYMDFMPIYADV